MIYILLLDHCPMIRKWRHIGNGPAPVRAAKRYVRPVRFESEFAIGPRETVQIVRLAKRRLTIEPAVGFDFGKGATLGYPQHLVDQLARAHRESTMFGANTLCQLADHFMVVAAFARWFDQFRPQDKVLVTAATI